MSSPTNLLRNLRQLLGHEWQKTFAGSANYWESRYKSGANSGHGSYGDFAAFKAEVLNTLITEQQIDSVIEFGCGDGNQLGLLRCPHYIGIDVSATAIETCARKYASDRTRQFILAGPDVVYPTAAMAMSLDVIYHLTEDSVFAAYMQRLFDSADRCVVIYSSNGAPDAPNASSWPPHVMHRRFTDWVDRNAAAWKLSQKIPNRYPYKRDSKGKEHGSFADFYIYYKVQ